MFVFAENEPIGSNDTRQPIPLERKETPPRRQETSPTKPKFSEPLASTEVVQGGKRPLGRLVTGPKPAVTTNYPFNRSEGHDSVGSSTEDSSVVSARALKKKEARTLGWWNSLCLICLLKQCVQVVLESFNSSISYHPIKTK